MEMPMTMLKDPERQEALPLSATTTTSRIPIADTDADSVHRHALEPQDTNSMLATNVGTRRSFRHRWLQTRRDRDEAKGALDDSEERHAAARATDSPEVVLSEDGSRMDDGSFCIVDAKKEFEEEDFNEEPGEDDDEAASAKRPKYDVVDATADGGNDTVAPSAFLSTLMPPEVATDAMRLANKQIFKFPWEKGRLAKVFSPQPLAEGPSLKLQPGLDSLVKMQVSVGDGASMSTTLCLDQKRQPAALYVKAVKHIEGGSYLEERAKLRKQAVDLWWTLLEVRPDCHDPGIAAIAESLPGEETSKAKENLDASLAVKSANTIRKRYYSMKAYSDWLMGNFLEEWIPMKESSAWSYIRHLHLESKPATRATSFLESVRFVHFVMRVEGSDEVLSSLRIKGLASQMLSQKKPWRPSDPLSVEQVVLLHEGMRDESRDLIDRILLGHMLHMVYSRSRWSDLLAVSNVFIDNEGIFLEASAHAHKGARGAETKTKLLPIVAPCHGVVSGSWAQEYLDLRMQAGLGVPGEEPSFMMPAPSNKGGGQWSQRYLTSQEANTFLKAFFEEAKVDLSHSKITTHSCKSTSVSWCAKYGVGPEHRAILARHWSSVQGPTALYSRDVLTSALRLLQRVLEQIRGDGFRPDATRSGMLTPNLAKGNACPATPVLGVGAEQLEVEEEVQPVKLEHDWPTAIDGVIDLELLEVEEELLQDRESSSSDEYSSSSSSDESDVQIEASEGPEIDEIFGVDHNMVFPRSQPLTDFYINGSSLVVHLRKAPGLFQCGRKISSSYHPIHDISGFRCSRCFND
eukprot:Skav223485  [mRNA]  locus=scaffold643:33892:36297:+ [translate_table: standard]